ncbi:MAG: GNAT family N-acetyltransferase [Candidatus Omnitrophota bacterium]|nr:GNAT family N-acetyltransferase [Candidatus Omnitrophota bacterium]
MFKLEIIDCLEKFSHLREEWDNLLDNSSADNIFLTWEWQFNWWKAFSGGKKLHIILARNETGELMGIAPLYIARKKIINLIPYNELKFIGTGNETTSEYLDFICYKGNEEDVLIALLKLSSNGLATAHILFLSDMLEDSQSKNHILGYINKNGFSYLIKEERPFCPTIKPSSNWEAYVQGLPKFMRRNLRSSVRKLEQSFKVEVAKFDDIRNANGAFEHFQRLYADRRNQKNEKNKYISESYKNFQENTMKSLSEKKWLYLCFLSLNNVMVAAQYCFRYKDKLYFYQNGADNNYAKLNVSQNLIGYIVKEAHENGITECDLLRGEEWYKMRWANGLRKKIRVIISSGSYRGNLYISLLKLKYGLILLLKHIIPAGLRNYIEKKLYS